jgi:16S rRNA G527 N7-methylase RsmG
MIKIVHFFLQKISVKFNAQKLKKFIDLSFIIVEKILIKFKKLHPLYFSFYDDMIQKEINLANISKDDKILHIGSGPIPASSILLAKISGAQVTSVEKNLQSVKQALSLICEIGISDKVQIQYTDAIHFPVEKFDIIVISQGISSYKELLEYISKSMKDDARVIFRTSSSLNGEIAQSDLFIKELFNVRKIVAQEKNGLLISILLLKKM